VFAGNGCGEIQQANANIAFMGDSITALWWLPKTNFGISGNTTTDMKMRFRHDVVGHGYKYVVILGGTNDMRKLQYTVDEEVTTAIANLDLMRGWAEADGLEVVLCTIPPIRGQNTRVEPLNAAIEAYAHEHQLKLVKYFDAMNNHPEYFRDGEHPNDHGYIIMQHTLNAVLPIEG
jgi:lysophospholipase L1-like esterase